MASCNSSASANAMRTSPLPGAHTTAVWCGARHACMTGESVAYNDVGTGIDQVSWRRARAEPQKLRLRLSGPTPGADALRINGGGRSMEMEVPRGRRGGVDEGAIDAGAPSSGGLCDGVDPGTSCGGGLASGGLCDGVDAVASGGGGSETGLSSDRGRGRLAERGLGETSGEAAGVPVAASGELAHSHETARRRRPRLNLFDGDGPRRGLRSLLRATAGTPSSPGALLRRLGRLP